MAVRRSSIVVLAGVALVALGVVLAYTAHAQETITSHRPEDVRWLIGLFCIVVGLMTTIVAAMVRLAGKPRD